MCILLGKVCLTLTRFSDGVKVIRSILYESIVPEESWKGDWRVTGAANTSVHRASQITLDEGTGLGGGLR